MTRTRAAVAVVAVAALAVVLFSGGSSENPRTPAPLPGLPAPFLSAAVLGDGGMTAGVDAYGDVVDLRAPGPAGPALIDNAYERQLAATVPADTGIVPSVSVERGPFLPLWRADAASQRYRPRTNVLVTEARFGRATVLLTCAAAGVELGCSSRGVPPGSTRVRWEANLLGGGDRVHLGDARAAALIARATAADRAWLRRSRALGPSAPEWATVLYQRSLLAIRALTDRRTGAVAAGPRDGWAYVWPRDAGAVAIALAASGHRTEARRAARFLLGLDLDSAARFTGSGEPVAGREAQGDAAGWTLAAAAAAGVRVPPPKREALRRYRWRDRADYKERSPGEYIGNALAAGAELVIPSGSGTDSAAAWAVRPFARPPLFADAAASIRRLVASSGRFGIVPAADWGERDPWTAPTAWSAWSLAALGRGPESLAMIAALRRAATPTGLLPERLDYRSGVPRSTTPLAWSHAFTALALRSLWPADRRAGTGSPGP